MVIDVHVAYLFAALCVLFGVSYTLGAVLDQQTKKVRARKQLNAIDSELKSIEA